MDPRGPRGHRHGTGFAAGAAVFNDRLKRSGPLLLAAVAAIVTLTAMIGVGYLFRDYLQPKSDVEILPLPTGSPVLEH